MVFYSKSPQEIITTVQEKMRLAKIPLDGPRIYRSLENVSETISNMGGGKIGAKGGKVEPVVIYDEKSDKLTIGSFGSKAYSNMSLPLEIESVEFLLKISREYQAIPDSFEVFFGSDFEYTNKILDEKKREKVDKIMSDIGIPMRKDSILDPAVYLQTFRPGSKPSRQ